MKKFFLVSIFLLVLVSLVLLFVVNKPKHSDDIIQEFDSTLELLEKAEFADLNYEELQYTNLSEKEDSKNNENMTVNSNGQNMGDDLKQLDESLTLLDGLVYEDLDNLEF